MRWYTSLVNEMEIGVSFELNSLLEIHNLNILNYTLTRVCRHTKMHTNT